MGRKAIPNVTVDCGWCGKQFEMAGKRYNQHIKLGYKIFACSPNCKGKYANTQITKHGRRKGTSPSAGWRLRKIQRQELFKSQIVKVQNDAKLELLEWLNGICIEHDHVKIVGSIEDYKDAGCPQFRRMECPECLSELESKLKEGR